MIIPKLHYITQGKTTETLIENIQNACTSGAELVQLRLKNASTTTVLQLAHEAREITAHFQTKLIINDYYKVAKEVRADGVHLGKLDSCPTLARQHLYTWQLIGGTANTVEDCSTLLTKEVDYIGLGPYRFTKTKENLSAILGIDGYAAIIEALNTKTPIIAVGGITLSDVTPILKTGVSGVAVSKSITDNFDAIKKFNQLLQTAST